MQTKWSKVGFNLRYTWIKQYKKHLRSWRNLARDNNVASTLDACPRNTLWTRIPGGKRFKETQSCLLPDEKRSLHDVYGEA